MICSEHIINRWFLLQRIGGDSMVPYRLLALDLDGTLLTDDKRISPTDRKWIGRATDAGVMVIIASGRGRQSVRAFRKELGLHTPMVLVNGGEVWGRSGELLERSIIPRKDIRTLKEIAEHYGADYWGCDVNGLVRRHHWTEKMGSRNWLKFGIRDPYVQVLDRVKKRICSLHGLSMTSSALNVIEVGVKGKSKATGVRKVCEHVGIKMEEVMAIGDNWNDFPLIRAAGFGVAMGNAIPQLKDVAKAVTDSNEQSGVGKAIEKYLLRGDVQKTGENGNR